MPLADDEVDAGYDLADVTAAMKRIRAECPTAIFSRGDYDWALSVANGAKTMGFVVFRPARPGQSAVRSDVGEVIRRLKLLPQ